MSENLENRITSTQAKDAIYKAHSISSSASEIDGLVDNFYVLPLTEAMENTDISGLVQSSLVSNNTVYIFRDGTYNISSTILLESNKSIYLGKNVILKNSVNGHNIFRNADIVNGNMNITLDGGILDYNNPTLSSTGTGTMCVLLNKVSQLNISNQKVINAQKYAYLIAGCSNYNIINLVFDTNSDGLHIQGYSENGIIDNIAGKVGDNLLAFTIGDYASYEINVGNMNNIVASNIFADDTFEPIRFVGKTGYYFDAITIDGVYGLTETNAEVLTIIQDGTSLDYTHIKTLTVKNVFCNTTDSQQFVIKGLNCENLIFDNIVFNNPSENMFLISDEAVIDNLTIKNIKTIDNYNERIVYVRGIVNNLTIDNIRSKYLTTTTFQPVYLSSSGVVKNLIINNAIIDYCKHLVSSDGNISVLNIDKSNITNANIVINKASPSTGNTVANISNSNFSYVNRFVNNSSSNSGSLRLNCINITFPNDTQSRFQKANTGTISVSGIGFRAKDLVQLTPTSGDVIFNSEPTFQTGIGIYHYKSSAWVQL